MKYQTEITCKTIQKKTTSDFLNEKITPNFLLKKYTKLNHEILYTEFLF